MAKSKEVVIAPSLSSRRAQGSVSKRNMRARRLLIGLGLVACSALAGVASSAIALLTQQVEWENDQVRVVRVRYGPLATTGMYEDLDRVVIPLSDLDVVETFANGGTAEIQKASNIPFWGAATRHSIESQSGQPIEAIAVGLLADEENYVHASAQDPSSSDALHYRVLLDERRVRVLGIHLGPHDKSKVVKHTDGVLVALTEAHLTAAGSANEMRRFDLLRGQSAWWPAGTEAIENPSDAPGELVWVQLKHVRFLQGSSAEPSTPNDGAESGLPPSSAAEVLTPTDGVDFQPYLERAVGKMKRNWYAVMPDAARQGEKGKVVVEFDILSDGKIAALSVVSNSRDSVFVQAAQSAVRSSSPFEPLPPGFRKPAVKLRFTFLYNLRP
jgi:TonB family protein